MRIKDSVGATVAAVAALTFASGALAQAGAPVTSQSSDVMAGPNAGATNTTNIAAAAGQLTAATSGDVTAGATVRDTSGGMVGKIEMVDSDGAVIATGAARVQIPVASFAKNHQGLVISASKAELEAAAKASSPS